MKKLFNLLTASVLLLGISTTSSYADDIGTDNAKKVLTAYVLNNLQAIASSTNKNNPNRIFIPGAEKPEYEVTIDEIDKEFTSNQLKAERKYKDVIFNVTGLVDSVSKDYDNKVYIELNKSSLKIPVAKAYLTKDGIEQAIEYDAGDKIELQCTGAENPNMIVFKMCQEARQFPNDLNKTSSEIVASFFKGEDISSQISTLSQTSIPSQLFAVAYAANLLPLDENCYNSSKLNECSVVKAISNESDKIFGTDEYTNAYNKNREFYHLP